MILKAVGVIVLLIGLYCLYLVIGPTGYSNTPMNLICGLLFTALGILCLVRKPKK